VVAVGVLGLLGPGGDAMLAANWQSLVLLVGGIGSGLWALRAVIERGYRERAGGTAAPEGPVSHQSEAEAAQRRRAGG
jgi:hypothetical protein